MCGKGISKAIRLTGARTDLILSCRLLGQRLAEQIWAVFVGYRGL